VVSYITASKKHSLESEYRDLVVLVMAVPLGTKGIPEIGFIDERKVGMYRTEIFADKFI
jgi:hypothetical protein